MNANGIYKRAAYIPVRFSMFIEYVLNRPFHGWKVVWRSLGFVFGTIASGAIIGFFPVSFLFLWPLGWRYKYEVYLPRIEELKAELRAR